MTIRPGLTTDLRSIYNFCSRHQCWVLAGLQFVQLDSKTRPANSTERSNIMREKTHTVSNNNKNNNRNSNGKNETTHEKKTNSNSERKSSAKKTRIMTRTIRGKPDEHDKTET